MNEPTEPPAADRLARVLARTRASLVCERALRAFWPIAALAAVLWSALAFGLAEFLSRGQMLAALLLALVAASVLLAYGARRFRWPSRADARVRVDADLPGRPLAALEDRPALGRDDPAGQAVWAAHLTRMRARAAAARAARPDLRLASRDPFALRLMALVVLFAALGFAGGEGVRGVGAALAPAAPQAVATGSSFEGWAVPPAYTGRPTLYLPELASDRPVPVPEGTEITLRGYGEAGSFAMGETVSAEGGADPAAAPMPEAGDGIAAATFSVARSGSVVLRQDDRDLGAWSFAAEADAPPQIELAEPIAREVSGEMRLSFVARDDYGVTAARATIALDPARADRRYGLAPEPVERPALEVDLPLPMTGAAGEDIADTLVEDFSKHPFAGLPVTLVLAAEDAAGQTGTSEAIEAVLPGKRFYDPLAAALVEQRRDLLWSPENARRASRVLRAASNRPAEVFDNERAYLLTRIAIRRLEAASGDATPTQIDDVAEMLWRAALLLEEGSLGDAAERLAKARERLSQALRSDASDDEIAELMDELREATRDYMEQLAQEAIERGETQSAENQPQGQEMTQDQIQQLMDRIQELSEQGRRAEAEALLEQLQQLLENMEMRLAEGGQGQGGPGQQSMQGLSDALREQQGLADESFQQLQREFQRGRSGQQGQGQGEGQQPGEGQPGDGQAQDGQPDPNGLAERQEALRELMRELQRGLPGAAGEAAREALREAERQMGEARDGLAEGDTAGALDRQADAIQALREGMRAMSEDIRQAQEGEGGQPGSEDGTATTEGGTDPLGRELGARGGIGTRDSLLGDGDAAARARGRLDEIRRRSGEQFRPELELDYLRRLLDRF